ncbi:MAG: restriction endonuclease subunit S [Gordonia sp. (in: high G+C Gram-positive bacteria)]
MTGRQLPRGWVSATLSQVASWGSGGTPKRDKSEYYGGPIPWSVIGDLTDGPVSSTSETISTAGLDASSAKMVPKDAVLIAMYGSIGKLGLPQIEMATNQAIAFAVPHRDIIDRRFLFWFLRSARDELVAAGKGGTQQNISQTILKNWQIPLPPLAEQHRIVDVLEANLSRLDAAEATLRQSVARLRSLTATTINYSLSAAPASERCAAPPAPADVVDGDLPPLPTSWRWQRLGELAHVVGGITKDAKKQSNPQLPLHPYLRVANVQAGYLDLDHITEIRASPAQVEKLTLQRGDVLLNEGGDRDKLGRGWVWEDQIPKCIHQNHVFRARVIGGQIDPRLIAWHANSFGRGWFIRNGKQSVNLASVSLTTIRSFPIPVPPAREQPAIVARISEGLEQFERGTAAIGTALERSTSLRQALLRAAFTGELVEQGFVDDPAAATLTGNWSR